MIIIHNPNDNLHGDPLILFNNTVLNKVESHKHLGMTLHSNVKWNLHIDNIFKNTPNYFISQGN